MYIQARKQRASITHKNLHGYYPSLRTLVISTQPTSSKHSASLEDESLRRWTLQRALWDLVGRLFVWEDANVTSIGGGSGLPSTTQRNDSMHSILVIDWKSTAFPLAITSWVKHSIPFSVRPFSWSQFIDLKTNPTRLVTFPLTMPTASAKTRANCITYLMMSFWRHIG